MVRFSAPPLRSPVVSFEHPLAYLLGIEGVALLRGFIGERDRAFTEARLAEVRALLADERLAEGIDVGRVPTAQGYDEWAATYDEPRNGLFDFEEPHVREILDALPPGDALDAACGTGRYAAYLAGLGHRVTGVDSSREMLAAADVPGVAFRHGDLADLPLPDDAVDLVVCALALTHLPTLDAAFAEFARVLRPGGHLVLSDLHHEGVLFGSIPRVSSGRLPAHRHRASDYLKAALPRGFQVRACEEPRLPGDDDAPVPAAAVDPGPPVLWPWSLAAMVPEAARAASAHRPVTVVWHFQSS